MSNTLSRALRIIREGGLSRFYQSLQDWLRYHPPFFKPRLRLRTWFTRRKCEAIADPFKIIFVDPKRIDRVSRFNDRRAAGTIRDSDWDCTSKRFEELTVYRGLHQRFIENKPWRETVYYEEAVETIETRGHQYGCWSPEEFLEVRCSYLDTLYATIRDEGYKPQSEIATDDQALHRNTQLGSQRLFHEVMVSIGREGGFLFDSGKHRLTIAKLLELDAIPAQVMVRHADWQQIRQDVYRDPKSHPELLEHPDLQDILEQDIKTLVE